MSLSDLWAIPNLYQYITIPLVAAFVGWSTNWVAIQLTFYPLKFWGIPPYLGWQGVIPSKAAHMARISVEASLAKLGTPREVFQELDPEMMKEHFVRSLEPWVQAYTKDVLFENYPRLFKLLPKWVLAPVYQRVNDRLPEIVDNIMSELTERIDELLDLEWLAIRELSNDPRLLIRIFQECGEEEFKFIINSGIYFGLLFGAVQAVGWFIYPAAWTLPLFGVITGTVTTWLALKIIFSPLNPKKVGPFVFQGLFLKRQAYVAKVYTRIVTSEILTLPKIADALINGPRGDDVRNLIISKVNDSIDDALAGSKDIVQIAQTAGINLRIERVRKTLTNKAVSAFISPFHDSTFAKGRQKVVEDLLYERMVEMTPDEFQALLRPAFQEDEFKLILAAGSLGTIAGIAQILVYL